MTARKKRPCRGAPLPPDASERDVTAATGLSRRRQWEAKKIADIPEDEFERLIESDDPPTVTALADMARDRAGSSAMKKRRRCPHCGGDLG